MSRSAPKISFSVTSINYGTIDVGASSAIQSYNIYQPGRSTYRTEAINMSISFKESSNASEARHESWVWVSVTAGAKRISSIGHEEITAGSIQAGGSAGGVSALVQTKVIVPSTATTAGAVAFYLHHRILAVIRRGCGYISTLVTTTTIKALNWIAGLQLSLTPFPL